MGRQSVLVLGAGGFIGRRVIAGLAATSWARPVAASRRITPSCFESPVEVIQLDASRRSDLDRALAGIDAVVSSIAGPPGDILLAGRTLLEAAARRPTPPKVVWVSSLAAYGSVRGTVDERATLLGDLGPYSAAKAEIDSLAARYPFVVRLRPGIVYGPESPWWSDRIGRLLLAGRLGDLGRRGEGICNLVHVNDVSRAAILALQVPSAAGEAFNLASPSPPTWNGYFLRYARALGVAPARRITRERLAMELTVVGPLLKVAERLTRRSKYVAERPAIRPWLLSLCRHEIRMDVRKAEELLGIRWLPLEAGLEQTARWFCAGGRTP